MVLTGTAKKSKKEEQDVVAKTEKRKEGKKEEPGLSRIHEEVRKTREGQRGGGAT